MQQSQIKQCPSVNEQKKLFTVQKPNLFSINTTENCLLNLFQGNPTLIKEACDFRFLTNKLKPHLIQISDTELLVYQTPSLTMQCQSKLSELDGCNFRILNIYMSLHGIN